MLPEHFGPAEVPEFESKMHSLLYFLTEAAKAAYELPVRSREVEHEFYSGTEESWVEAGTNLHLNLQEVFAYISAALAVSLRSRSSLDSEAKKTVEYLQRLEYSVYLAYESYERGETGWSTYLQGLKYFASEFDKLIPLLRRAFRRAAAEQRRLGSSEEGIDQDRNDFKTAMAIVFSNVAVVAELGV